jgi:hypothetical protein
LLVIFNENSNFYKFGKSRSDASTSSITNFSGSKDPLSQSSLGKHVREQQVIYDSAEPSRETLPIKEAFFGKTAVKGSEIGSVTFVDEISVEASLNLELKGQVYHIRSKDLHWMVRQHASWLKNLT